MPAQTFQGPPALAVLDTARTFWARLDPAWIYALKTYLAARVLWSAWSLVILFLFPIVLQNTDLLGAPVLTVLNSYTGERYVYSRRVNGSVLTFRPGTNGQFVDSQTGSVWRLSDGRALGGPLEGQKLPPAGLGVEEVFPYRGVTPDRNPVLAVWERFDAYWYISIADRGYAEPGSTVFLPLYPALIRLASPILSPVFAAIVVSNLALVGCLGLLYREIASIFSIEAARRMIAYLLLFPSAFFLLAPYGESLFLLLVLLAFVFARRGRWWVSGLCGVLAALTRLQGVLLLFPIAYMWYAANKPLSLQKLFGGKGILPLLSIPAATVVFILLTSMSLLPTYEGQLHARFVMPWENLWAAVMLIASRQGTLPDLLNLITTLLLAVTLIVGWRRIPGEYTIYGVAMFLAPLFRMTTSQPLVSMLRYVLVIFPAFALWAIWGRNRLVNRAVVYICFPLLLFEGSQFMLWGWVA